MRKVALIFLLAVFLPSALLAWLAIRSLRDQQFILERQQSLLCQGVADNLAHKVTNLLATHQRDFEAKVDTLLALKKPTDSAADFDEQLRKNWPLALVGFVVSLNGNVLAPSIFGGAEARRFRLENDKFLCNRESVEVYLNSSKGEVNLSQLENDKLAATGTQKGFLVAGKTRNIVPQQNAFAQQSIDNNVSNSTSNNAGNQLYSKLASSEAEFRQLVGDSREGTLARFLQNKLNLMFWYRSPRDLQLVFGALIDLPKLSEALRALVRVEPALVNDIAVALLDDNGRPVAVAPPDFTANWKRPFVATELGEALPHWEASVYLLNSAAFTQAARRLSLAVGLLVAALLGAIAAGGWLLYADLRRELTRARLKTDFVSNVSHELKTPLTSIRMFSELLAEGRVSDEQKQRSYLQIIASESARLTRLINNVLDFARMERGEEKYRFESCDISEVVRETVGSYRAHLESAGFSLQCKLPGTPAMARVDRDAIAQVTLNLLSNAEKYSNEQKVILVEVEEVDRWIQLRVTDHGTGVPESLREKIFEQFFRGDDSLSSSTQGSGLGLTLARQIARAHGGELSYETPSHHGSTFILKLPAEDRAA